ncbi:alpha/beta hydrolase [Paenibacillus ferrarius]|uniref:alpha/beta hydrolase n=1 Tax=Paenibacillus ferrarius TaxID=1469647 RepID=UPI003D2B7F67
MIWLIAGSIVVVAIALIVGVSIYVGWRLTHPKRKPLEEGPADYGLAPRQIIFPSRLGDVRLDGWFFEAVRKPQNMTIIMSHGFAGNRLEMGLPALSLTQRLVEAGYHVLMFDFRNSGLSEGTTTTIGYLEQQDVLGAVDWVKTHVASRIVLLGFSMGGSASLLAAAEEEAVLGVITDSAFSQLHPYLKENLPVWSGLPRFPFTPLILTLLPRLVGINPHAVDGLAAVDRIAPRPVLFIHSHDDPAIPSSNSIQMYDRHPAHFELWTTTGAGHVGSYRMYAEAYVKRLLNFLSKF